MDEKYFKMNINHEGYAVKIAAGCGVHSLIAALDELDKPPNLSIQDDVLEWSVQRTKDIEPFDQDMPAIIWVTWIKSTPGVYEVSFHGAYYSDGEWLTSR